MDVEKIKLSLLRTRLATSDMVQAQHAAEFLLMLHGPKPLITGETVYLRRALETGMIVCYARPFVDGQADNFVPRLGSPERDVHDELIRYRRGAHAHNDLEAELKWVTEISADAFNEHWIAITKDDLPGIIELCQSQAQAFHAKAAEITAIITANPPGR